AGRGTRPLRLCPAQVAGEAQATLDRFDDPVEAVPDAAYERRETDRLDRLAHGAPERLARLERLPQTAERLERRDGVGVREQRVGRSPGDDDERAPRSGVARPAHAGGRGVAEAAHVVVVAIE